MIPVYWFPKKCPKCKGPMKHVNGRQFTYMECIDPKCDCATSCTRGGSIDCSTHYQQFTDRTDPA